MESVNPAKHREIFYEYDSLKSFWHDIPLKTGEILYKGNEKYEKEVYNFVVEILPNTREKMEVSTEIKNNPIKLDRMYEFPIPFTYGMLPQTYEDPESIDPLLKLKGDDDPLDACDITNLISNDNTTRTGQVKEVVILGLLSVIDKGCADWKVIVVDKSVYYYNGTTLSDKIKLIVKGWYDADPKSQVDIFWNDQETIDRVIEHQHQSYLDKFKK